jgi:acetyl-CoA carboxylase biotin carboxyl carrier protein
MSEGAPIEAVRRLLQLVDAYGLAELEVEEDGLKVTIRGGELAAPSPAVAPGPVLTPETNETEPPFHAVVSPMTGIFYRSASSDVPPFVELGDRVEAGQAIGLIEAMKVFSEIPADRSGRVVEILVADTKLVAQGDTLMVIDPVG